jgi:hypothetical protein
MTNFFEQDGRHSAGIETLTACFYKSQEWLWVDGQWKCPHCAALNEPSEMDCRCGFDRSEVPDSCDHDAFSVAKLVIVLAL